MDSETKILIDAVGRGLITDERALSILRQGMIQDMDHFESVKQRLLAVNQNAAIVAKCEEIERAMSSAARLLLQGITVEQVQDFCATYDRLFNELDSLLS